MAIQLKRGTYAEWMASARILAPGQAGVATDTGQVRFGDGVHIWSALPAPSYEGGVTSVNAVVPDSNGNVTLSKASVGLGSVANKTEAEMVASGAIATKFAAKADLVNNLVPVAQIPAIATSDFLGVVANQAAMLAVTGAGIGDFVYRTDTADKWILSAAPATTLANWTELPGATTPGVSTVAGRTGAVTLTKTDVGLANVDNTTDAGKPISAAVQTALNGKVTVKGGGTMAIWPRTAAQGLPSVADGLVAGDWIHIELATS